MAWLQQTAVLGRVAGADAHLQENRAAPGRGMPELIPEPSVNKKEMVEVLSKDSDINNQFSKISRTLRSRTSRRSGSTSPQGTGSVVSWLR